MPVFGGLGQTATKKQQKIRALWLAFKKQPLPQKGQGSFLWALKRNDSRLGVGPPCGGFGAFGGLGSALFGASCIIIQFVPSDTIVAQLPTTAAKIAVPGEPPPNGTTSLEADTNN